MTPRKRFLNLRMFAVLSGFSSLTYEVIWARQFATVLGSTALAGALTFAVFLLGMGIGCMLLSKWADNTGSAIATYGRVELGIAALSALSYFVLRHFSDAFTGMLPPVTEPIKYVPSAFIIALLIMLPPTALMGATLPLMAAASKPLPSPHDAITKIYAWNTIGGALGTLGAGFVLIWTFGIAQTFFIAIAINAVVGFWALQAQEGEEQHQARQEAKPPSAPPGHVWLALAAISGFTVLSSEVLWARVSRFVLGDRTIAIAFLLFVFLTSLAVASGLSPRIGNRLTGGRKRSLKAYLPTILALGAIVQFAFAVLAGWTSQGGGLTHIVPNPDGVIQRLLVLTILIAPPTVFLGLLFPLLIWNEEQLIDHPASAVGRLYWINTVAAVAGALFAGFVLTRYVGTLRGFRILVLIQLATATAIAVQNRQWRTCGLLALLGVGLAIELSKAARTIVALHPGETLVEVHEDEHGIQVLAKSKEGMTRVRNNKVQLIYDLEHWQTSHAQQMAAHLTIMLAKSQDRVLNIGTGYGITAGAFTLYGGLGNLDTVEILPFLGQNQAKFSKYNFDYQYDPRVRIHTDDGRHFLRRQQEPYDIISVNVLDPYLPGSSSLYTIDFWTLARERLNEGGVFTQLFWGQDVGLLVKGIESVFPYVLYFPAYGNSSYNVVAFKDPPTQPLSLKLDRCTQHAKAELANLLKSDHEKRLQAYLGEAVKLQPSISAAGRDVHSRFHSDNWPILEYRWFHGAAKVSPFSSPLESQ